MIAKIVLNDQKYFSYVYFLCKHDYATKAVVFTPQKQQFELLDAFDNKYTSKRIVNVFDDKLLPLPQFGWEVAEKQTILLGEMRLDDCLGYHWLVNDVQLLQNVADGKPVPQQFVEVAMQLNAETDVFQWHQIQTEQDAEEFMDIVGALHDSYFRGFQGVFGRPYEPEFETKLQLSFELYGCPYDVMMEFYGGVDINYGLSEWLNSIYLSSIVFDNGLIYWVDGGDDLRPIDIKDNPYVCSKFLRWKIIPKLDD